MGENFGEISGAGRTPEEKPRLEKFEDFDLRVGDDIFSLSGIRQRILAIEHDAQHPGGGLLHLERHGLQEEISTEDITFQQLVDSQWIIEKFDRARLPEGVTARTQAQAAQMERDIQKASSLEEKKTLELKRAYFFRNLRPTQEDDDTVIL